jgi:alpha-N-arabinofuranosidase
VSAGLVAFQNEDHSYFIGVRREGSDLFLFLEKADGGAPRVVAGMPLVLDGEGLHLRIVGAGAIYSFQWSTDGDAWRTLADEDGTILHSVLPRDFVGTHLGPYARLD